MKIFKNSCPKNSPSFQAEEFTFTNADIIAGLSLGIILFPYYAFIKISDASAFLPISLALVSPILSFYNSRGC